MKKLIFVLIPVLLLASCSQGGGNISVSLYEPTAVLPAPSPAQGFTSCKAGESVSEYFYTGDLERFFSLKPEELISLLASDYKDLGYDRNCYEYVITYEGFNISLCYTPYFEGDHFIPVSPLKRVVISDFDFHGLNKDSSFDNVISTLGKSDLLTLHREGGFYYALCYIIGSLQYEFSEEGTGGLTLTVASASNPQVFYQSCGKGESVSKTLTIEDIKSFLKLSPEQLEDKLGKAYWRGGDEDTSIYYMYYDYLGAGFEYTLGCSEDGMEYIPVLPLECIDIEDFEFRGLNKKSTYEDITGTLKNARKHQGTIVDADYYYLQSEIDSLLFIFTGWDDSYGVGLGIKPAR